MSENDIQIHPHFFQLVLSLQSAASFQMGKTVSPISGKIEKDLAQARNSIDMLVMIQEKTKGNLSEQEKRLIDATVYNLQMNFLDEAQKSDDSNTEKATDAGSAEASSEEPADNKPDSDQA
ncbi:MAG: DUF1844 domain-containing protein [Candidatus Zixiibacteriota bacterium]